MLDHFQLKNNAYIQITTTRKEPDNMNKDTQIHLRLSNEDKETLKTYCDEHNISCTAFIYNTIMEKIHLDSWEHAAEQATFLRKLDTANANSNDQISKLINEERAKYEKYTH